MPAPLSPIRPSRSEEDGETRPLSPFSLGTRRVSKDQNSTSQSSMITIRPATHQRPGEVGVEEALISDAYKTGQRESSPKPNLTQRSASVNLAENRLSDFGNRPTDFFETDSSDVDESGSDDAAQNGDLDPLESVPRKVNKSSVTENSTVPISVNTTINKDLNKARRVSDEGQDPEMSHEGESKKSPSQSASAHGISQIRTTSVTAPRLDDSALDTPHTHSSADRDWLQRPWSENPQYYPYGLSSHSRDDGRFGTQTTINTIGARSNRSTNTHLAGRRGDRMLYAHAITMKSLANLEAGADDEDPAIDIDTVMGKSSKISALKRPLSAKTGRDGKDWQVESVPTMPAIPDVDDNDVRGRSALKDKTRSVSAGPGKRVSVVPPPIEVRSRSASSAEIVKTPFPEKELQELRREAKRPQPLQPSLGGQPHGILRKDRSSGLERSPMTPLSQQNFRVDAILPLSVHRRYKPHSRCVGKLVVPADPELIRKTTAAARRKSTLANIKAGKEKEGNKKEEEKTPKNDFDDAALFNTLRSEYHGCLLGRSKAGKFWRRYLSLRILKRIVLVALEDPPLGLHNDVERYQSKMMEGLRSPRLLVRKGLTETFSEEELFEHFTKPKECKGQYAWVHWAHRVSQDVEEEYEFDEEIGMVLIPQQAHKEVNMPIPGGLEFVEGWSIRRIVVASVLAVLVTVTPALVWILAGPAPADARLPQHEPWTDGLGSNDAEGRVVSGMLIAVVLGVSSWATVALWALASWLTM